LPGFKGSTSKGMEGRERKREEENRVRRGR